MVRIAARLSMPVCRAAQGPRRGDLTRAPGRGPSALEGPLVHLKITPGRGPPAEFGAHPGPAQARHRVAVAECGERAAHRLEERLRAVGPEEKPVPAAGSRVPVEYGVRQSTGAPHDRYAAVLQAVHLVQAARL